MRDSIIRPEVIAEVCAVVYIIVHNYCSNASNGNPAMKMTILLMCCGSFLSMLSAMDHQQFHVLIERRKEKIRIFKDQLEGFIKAKADLYSLSPGESPLLKKMLYRLFPEQLEPLLHLKLNVNIQQTKNSQHTPLTFVVPFAKPRLILSLLEAGADPNKSNGGGEIPLKLAIIWDIGPDCVRYLLMYGANVRTKWTTRTNTIISPLGFVLDYGCVDYDNREIIVKLLLQYGADPEEIVYESSAGKSFTALQLAKAKYSNAIDNDISSARELIRSYKKPGKLFIRYSTVKRILQQITIEPRSMSDEIKPNLPVEVVKMIMPYTIE